MRWAPWALVAVSLLAVPARAQTTLVLPAEFAERDAPWLAEVAGLSQAFRQQIVLRADELASVRGRTITKIAFRRDVQLPVPLRGGRAVLAVRLSDRATHPSVMSPAFADNRGPEPVEVFQGEIDVPEAPAPPRPGSPWTQPVAASIEFARPFAYRDGNLCIEIDGRPVPGKQPPAWPVDHAAWSVGGGMALSGRSCDDRLQAMAVWKELTPGSGGSLFASGPTQTGAVCLLGTLVNPGEELSGKRGLVCTRFVAPFTALGFVFPRVKLDELTRLEHPLVLPALPCLFSGQFTVQWLHVPNDKTGLGLALTHAQTVHLAHHLPVCPGATVRSGIAAGAQFPDRGEVFPLQMPVLQITVR